MNGTAIIRYANGRTKEVFLQQAASEKGGFWATSTPVNTNYGWHLHHSGRVLRERYQGFTNNLLGSVELGATWEVES